MVAGWRGLPCPVVCLLVACSSESVNPADGGTPEGAAADTGLSDRRPAADVEPPPPASGILVKGPMLLSQTGLYSDIKTQALSPGLFEFAPRWPLWSDGSTKRRWLELPQGTKVDTSDMNQWTFPVGTKLWKEFKVGGKLVETRFLWKQGKGWPYWWMGAYVWRADGSDAVYAEQGEADVLGTMHDVPSQVDCVRCHQGVADVGIGFSAMQLSAPMNSQLAKVSSMGMLTTPATQEYDAPGTGVVHDALAYLHGNCGQCHVETSWIWEQQSKMVLRLRLGDAKPEDTGAYAAIGLRARHDTFPMWGTFVVVPGKPSESQMWLRMSVRDKGLWQMPPIGTDVVDMAAVKTVGDWIAQLPPGPDL